MYPYFRVCKWLLISRRKPKIESIEKTSTFKTRVWFSDIDVYPELNNGRHLSLMDIGRYCHGMRMGLFKILKENNWGLMVAGNFTRYRRRIKFLQKFTLETKIVGYDDKWVYFYQQTKRGEVIHSAALVRTAITSKEGIVKAEKLVEKMGFEYEPFVPEWVEKWIELNELSPKL